MIEPRQQELMRTLWLHGRLSRWELHERTGMTPNTVGTLADALLQAGLIRECPPEAARMGRPRVPLEIDPAHRVVVGLALVPGRAEVARLGLNGSVVDANRGRDVAAPAKLVGGAASLLAGELSAGGTRTLAVGVTATGFIDPVHTSILFSSALPGRGVETLAPVLAAAGDHPTVLGNDMQALAARWLLTHRAEPRQDVLLVWFTDGRLGSALLVDGRPNRGSVTGGNELGHTRFPGVETDPCFCGQVGCLERIVSTPFLHRLAHALAPSPGPSANGSPAGALGDRVARYAPDGHDRPLDAVIGYLASSLSNAANFIRPHRLVLVSPYTRHAAFTAAVSTRTRSLVLPGLAERLAIDTWDQASTGSAENAAWLAMAELLYGGWDAGDRRPLPLEVVSRHGGKSPKAKRKRHRTPSANQRH